MMIVHPDHRSRPRASCGISNQASYPANRDGWAGIHAVDGKCRGKAAGSVWVVNFNNGNCNNNNVNNNNYVRAVF